MSQWLTIQTHARRATPASRRSARNRSASGLGAGAQDGLLNVNALQGLLIAGGAAYFLYRLSNVFGVALAARR